MKAIKISLAVAVIVAIAAGIYMWIAGINPPPPPPPPDNQFTKRIEQEIDSLRKMPDNRFCKKFHREIAYYIDDYHKNQRLGNSLSDNDQWKDILSKNLYSAYVDKFIKQAFYVFTNSEWNGESLQFIRSEYKALQNSPMLEKGGPIDKTFVEISRILNKYDEIAGFISSCNSFAYLQYGLSDRFPVSDMQSKISRASVYRNKGLGNPVNNCQRLHEGLKEIPLVLFKTHVGYLENKIRHWLDFYVECKTQFEYASSLYNPINEEINSLDNDIYNVNSSVFNSSYERLKKLWDNDSQKAYKYFSNNNKTD
jgi:hypothetical protein